MPCLPKSRCNPDYGLTYEDTEEKGSIEKTHPDDTAMLRGILAKVHDNPGIPFDISYRTKHKEGNYIFLEGRITNLLHDESIKGLVTKFKDVTENRKAEEK